MKASECWRLAKISLKARKKTTRNTVFGISFSLIIIIPLLFAIIGLNATVMPQLNKHPDLLNCVVPTSIDGIKIPEYKLRADKHYVPYIGYDNPDGLYFASDHEDFVNSFDNKIQYLIGKYELDNHIDMKEGDVVNIKNAIKIDDGEFIHRKHIINKNDYDITSPYPKVVTTLGYVYPNSYNLLKEKLVFADGLNKSFSGDGTKQILINERLLKDFNVTANDVYGKKLSYFIKSSIMGLDVPSGTYSINHYLMQDYEIVGVYKNYSTQKNDIRNLDMIVSTNSYMKNNVPYINYDYKYESSTYGSGFKSSLNPKSEDVINKSKDYIYTGPYEFSPYSFFKERERTQTGSDKEGEHYCIMQQQNLIFAGDYRALKRIQNNIKKSYNVDDETLDGMFSSEFTQYSLFDKYFSIATLVGGVFGGVVLFAALVNMFNTIKHSVDSRKHYLGVMRAIGARQIDIPNLYFAEIFRMLLRSYIAIVIVGSAICVGIKILIDYLASLVTLNIALSISWYLIPIVMAVLGLALIIIGVIYTLICTLNISRMPITTLLE